MANPLRFIFAWIACLVALAAAVVAVNYIIDPYEVFGTTRYTHLNLLKPARKDPPIAGQDLSGRSSAPCHGADRIVANISGDGRERPGVAEDAQPVYNYGIPGNYSPSVGLKTLREAIAVSDVKQAVVIIDFQNFLVPERLTDAPTEDDRRFHLLADGSQNQRRWEQVGWICSWRCFRWARWSTARAPYMRQTNPDTLNLSSNGTATQIADFANAARWDGMHDLFSQKADSEAEVPAHLARGLVGWRPRCPTWLKYRRSSTSRSRIISS